MSETEDFKSNFNCKTESFTSSVPPSSRATSSAPSSRIIPGNSENPIVISDSDGDGDFIVPSAKELAERRRLNRAIKEEPKDNVLNSLTIKREYYSFKSPVLSIFIFIVSGLRSVSPEIEFFESAPSISFKKNQRSSRNTGNGKDHDRCHGSVVKITSRLSVDHLDVVTSLPSTWAVPRDRSATLVDLSEYRIPSKRNGEEYTIDGFIRAEVCI